MAKMKKSQIPMQYPEEASADDALLEEEYGMDEDMDDEEEEQDEEEQETSPLEATSTEELAAELEKRGAKVDLSALEEEEGAAEDAEAVPPTNLTGGF